MFSLFRRKPRISLARSTSKKTSLLKEDALRPEPPTFEGYSIEQVDAENLARSIRDARLTPEQLIRWETALKEEKS